MSLRTPLSALGRSMRSFSTSISRYDGPSSSGSSSTSTGPTGFEALTSLLADTSFAPGPPTAAASTSDGPRIVDVTAKRGYDPSSLPPQAEPVLELMTNLLMKHGRKAEAQGRVSRILSLLQSASNQPPVPLLQRAIALSSPSVRVVSMRKRAKTVQTPLAIDERQRTRQGIAWILKAAEKGRKGGVAREFRIAKEVLAVLEGNSDVFKWMEERHKVATANRSSLAVRR